MTMPQSLSINFDLPIPLFPLPNCVLLPHATVPLHIFEPRYRMMVRDALADNRIIAMAMFEGNAWRDDYEGHPPLRPYVCVGYIIRHEALPDGRFNILLQGVCRARIVREVPHNRYRTAILEPTEVNQTMEIDLSDDRARLDQLLADPLLRQLACVSAIRNWASSEIPTVVLVDLAIMTTCDNLEDRYRMLAENSPHARVRWLEQMLTRTRRTVETAERFGPSISPDGYGLN